MFESSSRGIGLPLTDAERHILEAQCLSAEAWTLYGVLRLYADPRTKIAGTCGTLPYKTLMDWMRSADYALDKTAIRTLIGDLVWSGLVQWFDASEDGVVVRCPLAPSEHEEAARFLEARGGEME